MKEVGAVAFPETSFPLALVPVAVEPGVRAVTFSLIGRPRSNITIILEPVPNTATLLHSSMKHALIRLAISPAVKAFAFGLATFILTLIAVTAREELKALPISLVMPPCSFIHSP